jgi:hypothetical protein
MRFSIEVTPKVDISALPATIQEVSITYFPGADDIIQATLCAARERTSARLKTCA